MDLNLLHDFMTFVKIEIAVMVSQVEGNVRIVSNDFYHWRGKLCFFTFAKAMIHC